MADERPPMLNYTFFNRDRSWLSFNERVMMEAASPSVPLMERLKFLAIFSSNLDEFFRVRVPAIQSIYSLDKKSKRSQSLLPDITSIVNRQQEQFGELLQKRIISDLKEKWVHIVYKEAIRSCVI